MNVDQASGKAGDEGVAQHPHEAGQDHDVRRVRVHGATVHFVSGVIDGGAIIAQAAVGVRADDTEETLAARVLLHEHVLLPRCVRWLCEERLALREGRVVVRDLPPEALAIVG